LELPKKHHVTRKRKTYDQVEMERNLRMLVKTEKEKKEKKKETPPLPPPATTAASTPKKDTPLSKPAKVCFLFFLF
jgi:hypothetical protein